MIFNPNNVLEEWLKEQSKNIRVIILIISFLLSIWIGWYFWLSNLYNTYINQNITIMRLQKKISHYHIDRLKYQILDFKNKISILEEEIISNSNRLSKIENNAKHYKFLWFKREYLTQMLEAVLRRSLELNIQLDKIEKNYIPQKDAKKINKNKKELNFIINYKIYITGSGEFSEIIKLAYFIESFNLLIKIENIDISPKNIQNNNPLYFKIILDIYGAKKI